MDNERAIEVLKEFNDVKPVLTEELEDATDLAISALENELPFTGDVQRNIFKSVLYERYDQDSKWGQQDHDLPLWVGILGEEYGELCEAINETVFNNGTNKGGYKNIKEEVIQVAAVAIGFLECLERNKKQFGFY